MGISYTNIIMLFLQGKDRKCLQKYVAGTHTCHTTFKAGPRSKGYRNCLDYVTTNLEACSLMELIEADDFKRFHIDRTAWMTLKRIRNARSECSSLIKASTHTLRKITALDRKTEMKKCRRDIPKTYRQMKKTWTRYVKTFRSW